MTERQWSAGANLKEPLSGALRGPNFGLFCQCAPEAERTSGKWSVGANRDANDPKDNFGDGRGDFLSVKPELSWTVGL